jgi:fucose 4-O-acetylase-like acetyltransferase
MGDLVIRTGMLVAGRLERFDFLRGVAITLVVLGHSVIPIGKANLFGWSASFANLLIGIIYAIHMPIIFFVSGFVSNDAQKATVPFMAGLARWIVLPYVIWSVITVGLQQLAPSANQTTPFSALLEIAWEPVLLFWFLYTLFQIKTLHYILGRVFKDEFKLALALAAASFLIYPLSISAGSRNFQNFLAFLFFYEIGIAVARRPDSIPRFAMRFPLANRPYVVASASVVVIICVVSLRNGGLSPRAEAYLHLSGTLGIVGATALETALFGSVLHRWMMICGRYSMTIYVQHTIFGAALRAGLLRAGLLNGWIDVALITLAGLLLPILWQKAADRFGWTGYFGIRPVASSQVSGGRLRRDSNASRVAPLEREE